MAKRDQKYGKHNHRQNFAWLLTALGGGLLLPAEILFIRNNGTGGGTQSIAVDQDRIDYEYVKLDETRQFASKSPTLYWVSCAFFMGRSFVSCNSRATRSYYQLPAIGFMDHNLLT